MLLNLFKHSFRALNRQKSYLFINIAGLSIGIACSLIIVLFIFHELSYDKFNEKKDRIFRLVIHGQMRDQEMNYAYTSAPVGPTILREFPEVEDFTRLNLLPESTIKYQDRSFIEDDFIEADSSFFNIFSIPLLQGEKKTALNTSHKLVLAESFARKLFGKDDPINKLLKIGNDTIPYKISGVMADFPETSHFKTNLIGSFLTNSASKEENWVNNNFVTYLLLNKSANAEQVNAKMPELVKKYIGPLVKQYFGISFEEFMTKNKYNIYLQPLTDIHLNPIIKQGTRPSSDPKYLLIFGSIALLIIIVASINFMNLATAQASKRAKEIGIKKVCGSSKKILIFQFLTESVLISISSFIIAILLIHYLLPFLNNLLGTKLQLEYLNNWLFISTLLIFSIIIGLLSGIYPAFFLASFNPYIVLKGKLRQNIKEGRLRSILVVLQFSISIILIVGTIIMFRQIQFMLNKDLGFNKEQLLVISRADKIGNNIRTFKNSLAKIPDIVNITSSTSIPGHSESTQIYRLDERPGEAYNLNINYVDYDFFKTYGINIISGRAFNESFVTDKNACIINESAYRRLNLTNLFTTKLISPEEKSSIVGISKNFNFESLHNEINPYIFLFKNENINYGFISIRLSKHATTNTINEIEKIWKEFSADDPFEYFFMDQDFAKKYKEEKQNAQLSVLFSVLAIIIASLGLFGLTSFTIEQRTKEIGIRKTMGASIASIFYLISKEFFLLVSISAIIACPLIYYIANSWLQNYYYRIIPGPFDFLIGFILAIVIAVITISYSTIKSAVTNPVEVLRYE